MTGCLLIIAGLLGAGIMIPVITALSINSTLISDMMLCGLAVACFTGFVFTAINKAPARYYGFLIIGLITILPFIGIIFDYPGAPPILSRWVISLVVIIAVLITFLANMLVFSYFNRLIHYKKPYLIAMVSSFILAALMNSGIYKALIGGTFVTSYDVWLRWLYFTGSVLVLVMIIMSILTGIVMIHMTLSESLESTGVSE